LVFPFRLEDGEPLYAIFQRGIATGGYWQAIAGGGQDDETPDQAARREANEEAGIDESGEFFRLESIATIPVPRPRVSGFKWGPNVLVIPEYAFGVRVGQATLVLSEEHSNYLWLPYRDASARLHWQSNINAIWELDHRVRNEMLAGRTV
jgi:dATP pyrophosphohydrolase